MNRPLITLTVIILGTILGWVLGIGVGYSTGRAAGWQDGTGEAERFLTYRETKAYNDGRKCGMWMGRQETYNNLGVEVRQISRLSFPLPAETTDINNVSIFIED